MGKVRTAICLSGLPKEVDETWRTLRDNILPQFPNPDVFIYSGEFYPVGGEFYATFQPKRYKVEPQIHHWKIEQAIGKFYHISGHLNSYSQQVYGLKKVWEIKKEYEEDTGVTYDYVIRTRPDFIWLRPLKMEYLDLTQISTLHPNFAPTICAEFAVGPNEKMEKYFNIYDWLIDYGESYLSQSHAVWKYSKEWNSDSILTTYLHDYHHMTIGTNDKIPHEFKSPYDYYRIMNRHKRGQY